MTNAPTGLPFDDIRNLVKDLSGPDAEAARLCREHEAKLTKPPGALGRLEAISEWLSSWQAHYPPRAERVVVAVFAGNHGVVAQGVAAYPAEVTAQMVANFQKICGLRHKEYNPLGEWRSLKVDFKHCKKQQKDVKFL